MQGVAGASKAKTKIKNVKIDNMHCKHTVELSYIPKKKKRNNGTLHNPIVFTG